MAKAELIKYEPVPTEVMLKLSVDEARALQALFQRVGGSPSRSRRGLIDNIRNSLISIGLDVETDPKYNPYTYNVTDLNMTQAIFFLTDDGNPY